MSKLHDILGVDPVKQQIKALVLEIIPERKSHYKGKEAGGYGGNEFNELIYSSGRVDVIDEVRQKVQEL